MDPTQRRRMNNEEGTDVGGKGFMCWVRRGGGGALAKRKGAALVGGTGGRGRK